MAGVLIGFAIVGAVIFVGYVAGRLELAGRDAANVLSRTAFFITNPALLFTILAQADLAVVFSAYAPVALLGSVASALLYVLLSRIWFRRRAAETAVGAMTGSYVNANNIGIPIALYALGDATAVAPVLLVQLLILTPFYLGFLDLSSGGKASFKRIITQPVRNPIIIASVLGVLVAWTGLEIPDAVFEPLVLLGGAAVPLVLLAFGMSLRGSRPLGAREYRAEVIVATLIKTAAMPLITYFLARFAFGLENELLFAAVVMSALPTAQNTFLFASRYNRGIPIARDVIVLTSALAVPSLIVVTALLA
ncbi:AEC family transporter [Arthrobacter tecti]